MSEFSHRASGSSAKLLSAALLASAMLCGCSGGLRSSEPQMVTYVLSVPPAEATTATSSVNPPGILVLTPVAAPGLAQEGIALIAGDSTLDRYAASRWADELPRVVSALAVHTLRGSAALGSVSDSSAPFVADYLLRIDITHFEARYAGARANSTEAPTVLVRLECAIARRRDGVVVASFIAEANEAAAGNRMSSVIAAFDRASQSALSELRRQTLRAVAAQAPHAG